MPDRDRSDFVDCSTVIVSYNTFDLTAAAVRTALDAAPGLSHEVIVVDNASPDESAARLREAFAGDERVRVVESGGNVGFAAANNLGAQLARGRVLYFLNPDTLSHDDATARLVAYLDAHPEVGAVGPRVLNLDGTDQPSTSGFETVRLLLQHYFPIGGGRRLPSPEGGPQPVDIIKGCALAVRRETFERVGGWDERTFLYAEEDELCWSLREAGLTNIYLPEAVITHYGGASTGERYVEHQVLSCASSVAFLKRHTSPSFVRFNRAAGLVGFGVRALVFPVLAALRPGRAPEFRRRGASASALWRWFAFEHP